MDGKNEEDPEIAALLAIATALEKLDRLTAYRAMRWAWARYVTAPADEAYRKDQKLRMGSPPPPAPGCCLGPETVPFPSSRSEGS